MGDAFRRFTVGPGRTRARRRGGVRVLVAAAGVSVLAACSSAAGQTAAAPTYSFAREPTSSFVTASGTEFRADGAPLRFVGVNIYDAAATDRYSCDPAARMSDAQLRDALQELHDRHGATVLRFWAYQTYTDSGRDFSGVDRVIAAARDVGMRVIPVLEDGPGHCTTSDEVVPKSDYDGDTWFSEGYRVPYGSATLSLRDYARVVAEHYRDEPVILGWSLVNEADTSARDDQGRSVLVGFAQDMAGVLRAADPNHLITLGTQSNGARGASGPDFTAVYGVDDLDFAEVHDWGYWGSDSDPMPGGADGRPPAAESPACLRDNAPVGCSFAQLPALDKPLFVGEAGIAGGDDSAQLLRADQLGAKMRAAFDAGAAGYLLWRVTSAPTSEYDIVLGTDDPVLPTMAGVADALRTDG